MIQSILKTTIIMFLLAVIAASHTVVFAETDSNSLFGTINVIDSNHESDEDTDPYLRITQISVSFTKLEVQKVLCRFILRRYEDRITAIRAPPLS